MGIITEYLLSRFRPNKSCTENHSIDSSGESKLSAILESRVVCALRKSGLMGKSTICYGEAAFNRMECCVDEQRRC